MAKNRVITVQGIPVTVSYEDIDDFICITDIAAAKSDNSRAADVIRNWLRNRRRWNSYRHGKKYIIQILKCSNLNTLKKRQDLLRLHQVYQNG